MLNRDGHVCQVPVAGGRKCGQHATHVDHITPLAAGGNKWDATNCRAACQPCNLSRGAATVAGPTIPVTVVIGPPAAGKTTWVLTHPMARADDVMIDLDRIAAALTPLQGQIGAVFHGYSQHVRHVAIGARQAALRRAVALPASSGARAWVIHAIPTVAQLRQYVADGWTVYICDPGPEIVRARIAESGRGRRHLDAVDRWYATREQLLEALLPAESWDW